jgi:aldehyde:ferredoxin oxidoreductase
MAIPGYHNRVLEVDLSTGSVKVELLQPQGALLYLGGRGPATKLLYDRIDPKTDPLGPGNTIVIAASPLVGSKEPILSCGDMVYKSPLSASIIIRSVQHEAS